jgi:UDP-glucuronate 4-epimerase
VFLAGVLERIKFSTPSSFFAVVSGSASCLNPNSVFDEPPSGFAGRFVSANWISAALCLPIYAVAGCYGHLNNVALETNFAISHRHAGLIFNLYIPQMSTVADWNNLTHLHLLFQSSICRYRILAYSKVFVNQARKKSAGEAGVVKSLNFCYDLFVIITQIIMKILITGGAGFIGSNIAKKLMDRGDQVVLLDNFNDYYDPRLKEDRIKILLKGYKPKLYRGDIRDAHLVERIFKTEKIDKVIHLAAMAGVRNSLRDPKLYFDVNVMGSLNLLEAAVKYKIKNFVFASSSSVYGNNKKQPFSESDPVDTPISPYAASKKTDELIAHTYHHIYGLNVTALRFFTVYGPWGRPDMALFLFTDAISKGKPIKVFNYGKMSRNFTYVDDIATGTIKVLDKCKGYGVMNIGGDKEETLGRFIEVIEQNIGKKAKKKMMPIQPGDVPSTVADIRKLRKLGWKPTTRIEKGIKNFVDWYKEYYKIK